MELLMNEDVRLELLADLLIMVIIWLAARFLFPEAGVLLLAEGILLCLVNLAFTRRRYRKLEELSGRIDRILHGQEDMLLMESREGELAILTNQVQKMTIRLREQNELLKKDRLQLKEAVENIYHQLRTPFTAMNLNISLLMREELEEADRLRYVRELSRLLSRSSDLVEVLLKMARLDAGTVEFQREKVSVRDLLKKALEPLLIPLELAEISLQLEISGIETEAAHLLGEDEEAAPLVTLEADCAWTAEAVGNLVKNCMEHTEAGGCIRVCVLENTLYTQIEILDEGEGFAKEDMPHLFERFYRGKNASAGSVGIGLAFSRMVVTAQNGTLEAFNRLTDPSDPASEVIGADYRLRFYEDVTV